MGQATPNPQTRLAERCRKIYNDATTLAECTKARNEMHAMWLVALDLDAPPESMHTIDKYIALINAKELAAIKPAVALVSSNQDKIKLSLEDYYSAELERTGRCENLNVTAEELSARAKMKYGSDSAAATGTVLCDLIVRLVDSLEWD